VSDAVIIDSGGANLASLRFALQRLGSDAAVSSDAAEIAGARRVLLPGVGAAADAMARLKSRGLVDSIRNLRQPLLGICLGMQLLYQHSDEGDTECLGIVPGRVQRIPEHGLPIPQMGWNVCTELRDEPLLRGVGAQDYFYFVHSYAAPVSPDTVASVDYGSPLTAVIRRDNFIGVQFHPERSAAVGSRLLQNFLEL